MNRVKKSVVAGLAAGLSILGLAGCGQTDAKIGTENLKTAAEQFELNRRIVAVNTFLDTYVMEITGRCSLSYIDAPKRVEVTCKKADGGLALNTIVLSDNVAVYSEQTNGLQVDTDQYRVVFKPQSIVPNIDVE